MTEWAGHDHPVSHVRDVCALGYRPDVQGRVALGTNQGFTQPEMSAECPLLGRQKATLGVGWMVGIQRSTWLECLSERVYT